MQDVAFFQQWVARLRRLEQRVDKLAVYTQRAEVTGAFLRSAFADLPLAGKIGRVYYCTDCRKSGEGAGAGTGCPVWDDGSDWLNFYDNGVAAS